MRTTGLDHAGRAPDVGEMNRLAARLRTRSPTGYERLVKPVADRVLAALIVVVLCPLLIAVAVVVLVALGRPVFIGQTRAGRDGRPFTMVKFRTMLPDRRLLAGDRRWRGDRRRHLRWSAGDGGDHRAVDRRVTHKTLEDPRHTRTGLLLRRLSLDELPQLFNVLRGDMSLVGPRPELLELTNEFASWQHSRHLVRPGITGLWQTTGRGDGLWLHECVDLDLYYIADLSLRTDVAILLRTPLALLRSNGVI